jgi:hypothetical protein
MNTTIIQKTVWFIIFFTFSVLFKSIIDLIITYKDTIHNLKSEINNLKLKITKKYNKKINTIYFKLSQKNKHLLQQHKYFEKNINKLIHKQNLSCNNDINDLKTKISIYENKLVELENKIVSDNDESDKLIYEHRINIIEHNVLSNKDKLVELENEIKSNYDSLENKILSNVISNENKLDEFENKIDELEDEIASNYDSLENKILSNIILNENKLDELEYKIMSCEDNFNSMLLNSDLKKYTGCNLNSDPIYMDAFTTDVILKDNQNNSERHIIFKSDINNTDKCFIKYDRSYYNHNNINLSNFNKLTTFILSSTQFEIDFINNCIKTMKTLKYIKILLNNNQNLDFSNNNQKIDFSYNDEIELFEVSNVQLNNTIFNIIKTFKQKITINLISCKYSDLNIKKQVYEYCENKHVLKFI